jgi:hypothetical protein
LKPIQVCNGEVVTSSDKCDQCRYYYPAPEVGRLVEVVKKAYRKHWLDDPDIGYAELGTVLMDALCNTLGDDGFNKWIGEYHAALAQVKGG